MSHLLKKTFISVDLETLSTHQNGTILSIGAVKFTIPGGLTDEFTMNISPASCKEYGLHVEKSTVQWWMTQPAEVRASWQKDPQSLPDALNGFNDWLSKNTDINEIRGKNMTYLMANGSVFDFGLLRSAYEATGIERGWPYWAELDLRTIAIILDTRLSKGNEHTALGDAKNQAQQFIQLFKD